jgi:hypothetical protein
MLELGEEGRRARMGAVRTERGPQPFIGAGGRRRCLQWLAMKVPVTRSEEGGFTIE